MNEIRRTEEIVSETYESVSPINNRAVIESKQRVRANFRMRLKETSEKNRDAYVLLKNKLAAYKGVTFRMSGRIEKVNYNGESIAYIGVARKHLKIWLALNPSEYEQKRYRQRDESDKPRFQTVPMLVKVGSDRALKRAEELIDELTDKYGLEQKKKYAQKTLQELAYTLRSNALIKDKKQWLLRESIHVHDTDALSNEDAEYYLENTYKRVIGDKRYATVSLDVLDAEFTDGQKVTLERLKSKGIVGSDYNAYKVIAGERLTKPLYVAADEYSLSAVKMIVLTGGRAVKIDS